MDSNWHERLTNAGWTASTDYFWNDIACFYDLGLVKTVILFKTEEHDSSSRTEYAPVYYWKYGSHKLPEYVDQASCEIRRYKLHHSMNALLWHDHGDRPLWPL